MVKYLLDIFAPVIWIDRFEDGESCEDRGRALWIVVFHHDVTWEECTVISTTSTE